MPSNNILINHVLSYEVNDKDIPRLIEWLEGKGYTMGMSTDKTAIGSQQPS